MKRFFIKFAAFLVSAAVAAVAAVASVLAININYGDYGFGEQDQMKHIVFLAFGAAIIVWRIVYEIIIHRFAPRNDPYFKGDSRTGSKGSEQAEFKESGSHFTNDSEASFSEKELWAYEVLGVECGADFATIKQAFRKKARENHPDLADNKWVANKKMSEINEAYEILKDRFGDEK